MGATGVTIRHIEIKSIEMGRSSGSCRGRGGGGKVDLRRGMGGEEGLEMRLISTRSSTGQWGRNIHNHDLVTS